MQLIVFTSSSYLKSEGEKITNLFKQGLDILHIRKKNPSLSKLKALIESIPEVYHGKIVLHNHHKLIFNYSLLGVHFTRKLKAKRLRYFLMKKYLRIRMPNIVMTTSVHTTSDLSYRNNEFTYVFLSPVFDSISKQGHTSPFTKEKLEKSLKTTSMRVIALGGIDDKTAPTAIRYGFSGIAVSGFIWQEGGEYLDRFNRVNFLAKRK